MNEEMALNSFINLLTVSLRSLCAPFGRYGVRVKSRPIAVFTRMWTLTAQPDASKSLLISLLRIFVTPAIILGIKIIIARPSKDNNT